MPETGTETGTETTKTPAGILECAANLIEEKGLAKGSYLNSKGEFCTIGAIRQCGNGSPYTPETDSVTILARYLLMRELGTPIHVWNDHPHIRKEEVVARLREVARKLRDTGEGEDAS